METNQQPGKRHVDLKKQINSPENDMLI